MAQADSSGGRSAGDGYDQNLVRFQERLIERLDAWEDDGRITVLTLTFCRRADLFYGTSLLFKTLRIGFPTARVIVVENASLPTQRPEIERLAEQCRCEFIQILEPSIEHEDFLEVALGAAAASKRADAPLVFLDPDVCFWENCEEFSFDGLAAGKLDRAYEIGHGATLSMPRVHTSFMWIPSPRALWEEIQRCREVHYDFYPFASCSVRIAGRWCRYDTGASLYAALNERMNFFTEEQLRRYDHLYCGCHIDWLEPHLDKDALEVMKFVHTHARNGDMEALRGARKLQLKAWRQLSRMRLEQGRAGSWQGKVSDGQEP